MGAGWRWTGAPCTSTRSPRPSTTTPPSRPRSSSRIGARFAPVERADGKRPVRELVGVPRALIERWSSRRAAIARVTGQLAAQFTRDHGRVPDRGRDRPAGAAGQPRHPRRTSTNRAAKHDQRDTWAARGAATARPRRGTTDDRRRPRRRRAGRQRERSSGRWEPVTAGLEHDLAESVLAVVSGERATWQHPHLLAEARRQVRAADIDPADVGAARAGRHRPRGRGLHADRRRPRTRQRRSPRPRCATPHAMANAVVSGRVGRCSPRPAGSCSPPPRSSPPSSGWWRRRVAATAAPPRRWMWIWRMRSGRPTTAAAP